MKKKRMELRVRGKARMRKRSNGSSEGCRLTEDASVRWIGGVRF